MRVTREARIRRVKGLVRKPLEAGELRAVIAGYLQRDHHAPRLNREPRAAATRTSVDSSTFSALQELQQRGPLFKVGIPQSFLHAMSRYCPPPPLDAAWRTRADQQVLCHWTRFRVAHNDLTAFVTACQSCFGCIR